MTHADDSNPRVYARRIAYMSDASAIYTATRNYFGDVPGLPSKALCEQYWLDYRARYAKAEAQAEARAGGIPARHQNIPRDKAERNELIVAEYVTGKNFALIGREFGISADHVRRVVIRAGAQREERHGPRSRFAVTQRLLDKELGA